MHGVTTAPQPKSVVLIYITMNRFGETCSRTDIPQSTMTIERQATGFFGRSRGGGL